MWGGDMMGGWSWGMGWMGIVFWLVLVLGVAALIKYLLGGKSRD